MLTLENARLVRSWLVPVLLVFLSRGGASMPACPVPEGNSEREQALRKRVDEFYNLLQAGNSTQAEAYLTPDSLETFRAERNRAFAGFEVQSVKMGPDGASADVQVQIHAFSPLMPAPIAILRTTQWVLTDGVWRLAIPKRPTSPTSPFASEAKNAPPAPSELNFKAHQYHFGRITQGQVKVAHFPFTNETHHVVKIADVETACDCLTVKLAKQEYQPGESGEIEVRFDSTGYLYVYSQTMMLKTDPGSSPTLLTVDATIDPARPPARPQASQKPSSPPSAPPPPNPNGP